MSYSKIWPWTNYGTFGLPSWRLLPLKLLIDYSVSNRRTELAILLEDKSLSIFENPLSYRFKFGFLVPGEQKNYPPIRVGAQYVAVADATRRCISIYKQDNLAQIAVKIPFKQFNHPINDYMFTHDETCLLVVTEYNIYYLDIAKFASGSVSTPGFDLEPNVRGRKCVYSIPTDASAPNYYTAITCGENICFFMFQRTIVKFSKLSSASIFAGANILKVVFYSRNLFAAILQTPAGMTVVQIYQITTPGGAYTGSRQFPIDYQGKLNCHFLSDKKLLFVGQDTQLKLLDISNVENPREIPLAHNASNIKDFILSNSQCNALVMIPKEGDEFHFKDIPLP